VRVVGLMSTACRIVSTKLNESNHYVSSARSVPVTISQSCHSTNNNEFG
jgi:hypothetical protein